jgi:hypothetical protein
MSQRFPYLFTGILCALIGLATGWTLAKIDHTATCNEQTTHAYLTGKQVGYAEAQQNGACVRWWTGTSRADMQAARRAFCRGR